MVFYSRYYIQEMLLSFLRLARLSQLGAIRNCHQSLLPSRAGFASASRTRARDITSLPLRYAGAEICTVAWGRLRDGEHPTLAAFRALNKKHVAIGIVTAAAISILFFSSFFTHWRGVYDSILTYANYTNKANTPHMHDKPWYYYLQMLVFTKHAPYPWFSEALILGLGALGIRTALTAKRADTPHAGLLRFLAFYTVLVAAAYSVIAYKTPWCAINFLQPLIVMAGVGADALIRGIRPRVLQVAAAIVLALLTLQLTRQTCLANFEYPADPRNPYVYAHTSGAIAQLRVNSTVSRLSRPRNMTPRSVPSPHARLLAAALGAP